MTPWNGKDVLLTLISGADMYTRILDTIHTKEYVPICLVLADGTYIPWHSVKYLEILA